MLLQTAILVIQLNGDERLSSSSEMGCAGSDLVGVVIRVIDLAPTELFLLSFWWIPRRYMLSQQISHLNVDHSEPLIQS